MNPFNDFLQSLEKRLASQQESAIRGLKSMTERDCSYHAGYIAACTEILQDFAQLMQDTKSW